MGDASHRHLHRVANRQEFAGGRVLHLAILVERLVNTANDLREGMYALRQAEEGRVGVVVGSIGGRLVGRLFACRFRVGVCFVVASEEVHQGYDGGQRAFEVEEVNLLHIGAVGADAQQGLAYIEEVLLIHIVLLLHKLGKLAHAAQRFLHINEAAAELQVAVHPFSTDIQRPLSWVRMSENPIFFSKLSGYIIG